MKVIVPPPRSVVPCNGCHACCSNELLILHPDLGDRIETYEYQRVTHPFTGKPALALEQKPNGDCFYLGEAGCTIHDRAPAICKKFDCRKFLLDFGDRPARRRALKSGTLTREVYDAGTARLGTLTAEERK